MTIVRKQYLCFVESNICYVIKENSVLKAVINEITDKTLKVTTLLNNESFEISKGYINSQVFGTYKDACKHLEVYAED